MLGLERPGAFAGDERAGGFVAPAPTRGRDVIALPASSNITAPMTENESSLGSAAVRCGLSERSARTVNRERGAFAGAVTVTAP